MPLEFYPPTTNLLNSLAFKNQFSVKIWTTRNNKGRKVYKNKVLNAISRTSFPNRNNHKLVRFCKYLLFNIKTFLGLLIFNPSIVMYYETYSAGPVYWYLKYFGSKKKLFIHYHEYFNQEWYDSGMAIVKLYYHYEKNFLLQKAEWVSQTNLDRLKMFASDHPEISQDILKMMPNYPPKSWFKDIKKVKSKSQSVIKSVYVGALSLKDTFIKEYCDWIVTQNGKVHFHIYAYNLHDDTKAYLESLKSEYIVFYPKGVEYIEMPNLLSNYDIGLILYRAQTDNYRYNAPNKLFEYLVCGLDVWLPEVMEGCKPYLNAESRPLVQAIDFTNLKLGLIEAHQKSLTLPYRNIPYHCETELQPLITLLKR